MAREHGRALDTMRRRHLRRHGAEMTSDGIILIDALNTWREARTSAARH